jgi:hypothetical protein
MFIRIPPFHERGKEVVITAEDDIYAGIEPTPRTAKEDKAFQAHWRIVQPDAAPYPKRICGKRHINRDGNKDDDGSDDDE